jgi:hypothetical protein
MTVETMPVNDNPARDLATNICEAMGLRRCPYATAQGSVVLCGCPEGRCDQRHADRETRR